MDIGERVEKLEKSVADLRNDVESVTARSINEMKSELSSLKGSMQELKQDVRTMSTTHIDFVKASTSIEFIRESIVSLGSEIKEKDRKIDAHITEAAKEMNCINDRIDSISKSPGDVAISFVKWAMGIIGAAILVYALSVIEADIKANASNTNQSNPPAVVNTQNTNP